MEASCKSNMKRLGPKGRGCEDVEDEKNLGDRGESWDLIRIWLRRVNRCGELSMTSRFESFCK